MVCAEPRPSALPSTLVSTAPPLVLDLKRALEVSEKNSGYTYVPNLSQEWKSCKRGPHFWGKIMVYRCVHYNRTVHNSRQFPGKSRCNISLFPHVLCGDCAIPPPKKKGLFRRSVGDPILLQKIKCPLFGAHSIPSPDLFPSDRKM